MNQTLLLIKVVFFAVYLLTLPLYIVTYLESKYPQYFTNGPVSVMFLVFLIWVMWAIGIDLYDLFKSKYGKSK